MPPASPPAAPPPAEDLGRPLLQQEYVAGGGYSWAANMPRVLPWSLDDLTRDFGDDVYDRMMVDSQVSACITVMKASILEDGLRMRPAITDKDADGYDLAKEIHDEAEAMLKLLAVPLDEVLWDMTGAVAYGNKMAEQVYELRKGITDKGKNRTMLQLARLKVKPRRTVAFVVDQYLNILGVVAVQSPGRSSTLSLPDAKDILPRTKFAILVFRPFEGDPRGTSALRSAFDPWWRKRQIHVELLKYMTQFASPSIWATTPEKTSHTRPTAPGVAPVTPEQELFNAIQTFRNGTAAAFGYGTVLNMLQSQSDGRAFFAALANCDKDITKAILTQELATESGAFQTRAAASVHQDVLDTLVKQGKQAVIRMLTRDVLLPWIAYNWPGKEALELVPTLTLGEVEQQDKPAFINALATYLKAGGIDDSQLPAFDEILGFPTRDPDWLEHQEAGAPSGAPGSPAGVEPGPATGPGGTPPSPPPVAGPTKKPAAKLTEDDVTEIDEVSAEAYADRYLTGPEQDILHATVVP